MAARKKVIGGQGRVPASTPDPIRDRIPPVVGVGASAGGIKAFQTLAAHVPRDAGIAWVFIQHMAPDRESHLTEILARQTTLPVMEVVTRRAVAPDCIYVIAPGRTMTIHDGILTPVTDDDLLARRTSIDAFFLSLATDRKDQSGCALLSGAGTDGTIGLKAIKEAGGLTLTQTLGVAEYDSMLLSAVRTGLVDRELPIEDMASAFADFLTWRRDRVATDALADDDRLRACRLMRASTGHDFSGYKAATVHRRIQRRMQMLGVMDLSEYLQRLEKDKAEATLLFRDMLIGVTQFFRNPEAFAALATSVLPEIFNGKTADDDIRVWVPGCATGEEAYSLAMLLLEHASGVESMPELKIFGSDIDDTALHAARLGRYPKGVAADVIPDRLERFFDKEDGTFVVRSQLREICLFAQHNVLRDPPFSRIDLIVCRNVLIYMNAELQRRLMPVFHYALRRDGFLFLGPAENASQAPALFREVDRGHHFYRRLGEAGRLPDFPIAEGNGGKRKPGRASPEPVLDAREQLSSRAARRVLSEFAPAYVVIDQEYTILDASSRTGAYLELPAGRPRINLGAMARSGLAVDVRAAVARVMASGKRETLSRLTFGSGERRRELTLVVEPMADAGVPGPLYLVVFHEGPPVKEVTAEKRERQRDDEVTRALEVELLTTKERLQTALEELETSNEELKASNEELSSVNEELQSSNEELETSKEELQSINEELRTVNAELNNRVEDLSRANNDLKNLFANTKIAMLFLDESYRIMNFTPPAKPLFGLRDHDVGRPLDELSGRVDCTGLKTEVQTVIRESRPVEHEVRSNGDEPARTFIMRILPYLDEHELVSGAVLTFIDITERKRAENHLASMVSELNHRVKNSLASVQAIVHQTQAGVSSVTEFSATIEGRLQAMVSAHNLLSENAWEHADLRCLAETVLAPFADAGSDRLSVSGAGTELRPGVAVSMGMILHELATNAMKHGAWSVPEGSVSLHWEIVGDGGGAVKIGWTERRGPAAIEPDREGFGLHFVRKSAQYELGGECETEFANEGFRCVVALPTDKIAWRSGA